jgi:hypothetical protein
MSTITKPRADLNSRIIKIPGPINFFYPGCISRHSKKFCNTEVVAHVKLVMDNISVVAYITQMGDPFPIISECGNNNFENVIQITTDVSRTFSRGFESKSGQRIQGSDRSQRLEIESNPVPGTFTEMGPLGGRSVRVSTNIPITAVCELETRQFKPIPY